MVLAFRSQPQTQGVTSVTSADSWTYTVEDSYRRLVGFDFVGDVERAVYVDSRDGSRNEVFGGNISGEGDTLSEYIEIELEKDDEIVIDYQGSATVSDVAFLRTDRPLRYRVGQLAAALETNEV